MLLLLIGLLTACDSSDPIVTATRELTPTPAVFVNRRVGYTDITGPVAKVDDVAVWADDFNHAIDEGRATIDEQSDGKVDWNSPEGKEILIDIRLQTLEGLINYQVVAAVAAKENVTASLGEVQNRLDDFKKQLGSPENYTAWLARRFISESDHKKRLAQILLFDQMSERHSAVEDKAEQAHVRHILVNTEVEARDLYARLQQASSFEALAKQFSIDIESGAKGGDLGWIFRGQTDPVFENIVFSLLPNQISGPIKTEKGYHLIQTLAKEVRPLPFDLIQQRRGEAFAAYIQKLREASKIERLLTLP